MNELKSNPEHPQALEPENIHEVVSEQSQNSLMEPDCSFTDLIDSQKLLAAVENLGFKSPTKVQARTIPRALNLKDIVVQAQTGSGKTVAFCLPLLALLPSWLQNNGNKNSCYSLIVTPTRELANQVTDVIDSLSKEFTPSCLIGGVSYESQLKALSKDQRIVVGTPGRILDLLKQKQLSLRDCKYFVLDEADETLSMGFLEDVRAILSRLPDNSQGLFVSATITPRVEMLASSFLSDPELIVIDSPNAKHPQNEHFYCDVKGDLMAKPTALCDIIETLRPRSSIIFCNTKSDTQLVEALLRRRGFDARRLNSDLTQFQRTRVMNKIRAGELKFLIATDIAARGIDLEQIDLVINYSIHEQPETYVHRTGRTGRAGRRGKAISLVGPRDFGSFHFLTKVLDFKFNKMELPSDEDVANARLAHLYQILRLSQVDISDRQQLVASKFLRESGGIEQPSEDLLDITSRLVGYTITHNIQVEASSLEDELEQESLRSDKETSSSREKSRRSEHKGRNAGRKNREDRERNNLSSGKHSRQKTSDDLREDISRKSEYTNRREESQPDEIRLYIGKGLSTGLTAQHFKKLACEFGSISENSLRQLTLREHYGFVDLYEPEARKLCKNLNGIEFNGEPLTVEFATILSTRRHKRGNRKRRSSRHDNYRRSDNRRRRRNDRRGRDSNERRN